jgi:Protein of unknown function (DUF2752).
MSSKYGITDIEKFTIKCYYAGILAGVVFICGIIVIKLFNINILHILPPCEFYTRTGFYCAGCGGTRAVNALLHGRIWRSFLFHPFVLYTFVIYLAFLVKNTLYFITKGKVKLMLFRPGYVYLGAVIIVIQWIIKVVLQFMI